MAGRAPGHLTIRTHRRRDRGARWPRVLGSRRTGCDGRVHLGPIGSGGPEVDVDSGYAFTAPIVLPISRDCPTTRVNRWSLD